MTVFTFQRATKAGCKARIALVGGPGSGKTWTALSIAQGLRNPGRVGVIDTDRHSAKKYADRFDFDWLGMTTYDPADLTRATIAAREQHITTLIVDTMSPFWSGAEGMLDRVGGYSSSFEGWRNMRPIERQMMDALLGYDGHVIICLRTKVEYVVETNDKGRAEPRRIGMKPEQRDGVEYEVDVLGDLDNAGQAMRIGKTRCPELAGKVYTQPGLEVGEAVQAWLDRDAVGDTLNPHTVRDWALADGRTLGELRERYEALSAAGQLDAVVYGLDGTALVGIGPLITERARTIKKALTQQVPGPARDGLAAVS
jgi:hypothetical protein